MLNNYPHCGIWINGRNISFDEILNGAKAGTTFEENTFDFIQRWLKNEKEFRITTSGSTGRPKEIVITRSQMIASAAASRNALNLKADFNSLVCLDTAYIAGRMMIVRSFITGMKIIAVDPCASPLEKIPTDEQVHFAALVPYQIQATLESKHPHLLSRLLTCIIGGAPLSIETVEKLQQYSCDFYATYGMTETISHIALQKLNGQDRSSYFTALSEITVATDDRSCLKISAPYIEEEIITNDVVEMIGTRSFQWRGRWDNVINSGGLKLSPEILESQIGQIFTRLNFNTPFFLHGIPDDRLGEKLILIFESNRLDNVTLNKLHQQLMIELKTYEVPKEYYFNPQFALTDTGKVNRRQSFQQSLPL